MANKIDDKINEENEESEEIISLESKKELIELLEALITNGELVVFNPGKMEVLMHENIDICLNGSVIQIISSMSEFWEQSEQHGDGSDQEDEEDNEGEEWKKNKAIEYNEVEENEERIQVGCPVCAMDKKIEEVSKGRDLEELSLEELSKMEEGPTGRTKIIDGDDFFEILTDGKELIWMPTYPEKVFKKTGDWKGWSDWLGNDNFEEVCKDMSEKEREEEVNYIIDNKLREKREKEKKKRKKAKKK